MADRKHDSEPERKARGAFFTPPTIANFLADWAVGSNPSAKVLDPTCGEAVFLLAAARRLKALGCSPSDLDNQVFGVDLHDDSLGESLQLLEAEGLDAHLLAKDFFGVPSPQQPACPLPQMDAVIGNPPFVRYQEHSGATRKRSLAAALAQGVRLSGLASSWAALLVHACAFLKPDGRLAMVLPSELLTVHYAEPVRLWLRRRFASVTLVMFDRLQFADALEKVVLVVAEGTGGCDTFSLLYLDDADDLARVHPFDVKSAVPAEEGKWTELLLPQRVRQSFVRVNEEHFTSLGTYGSPELGTVTGANAFFTLSEQTRREFGLSEKQLTPTCPPGTRHLKGLSFTEGQWRHLKNAGEAVWMLYPNPNDKTKALQSYLAHGEKLAVHEAYKCQVRTPWWRPPVVSPPDMFFTYMSHRYPRLVSNTAGVTLVNSMHGVRLKPSAPKEARSALPLLAINSVTMLGAELRGRSYGGGILKMEPREAASLPVPGPSALVAAWNAIRSERRALDTQLRKGQWIEVVKRVDEVLLFDIMKLSRDEVLRFHEAARTLRERRIGPSTSP